MSSDTAERWDNTGLLYKNDRKNAGSRQPDYTGYARIDGVEKEIAAWVKDDRKRPGRKFLSLTFKNKGERGTR